MEGVAIGEAKAAGVEEKLTEEDTASLVNDFILGLLHVHSRFGQIRSRLERKWVEIERSFSPS